MRPHEEFLELCAISTSGDLTEEEQNELNLHLAECSECRQALKEFEAAVDVGVPLLASKLSTIPSKESKSSRKEWAEHVLSERAVSESSQREAANVSANAERRGFAFAQKNGHERTHVNWNYVWMPFAACIVLTVALGIYAYRLGRSHDTEVVDEDSGNADGRFEALEQRISDAGHEREVLRGQLDDRDKIIAEFRRQTAQQASALSDMRSAQANLEQSLQADDADKKRVEDERARLAQNFDAAQTMLQKMQSELDAARRERIQVEAQEASLQSQIRDLSGQLQEQRQNAVKQDELLSHDRDIRDLMGARDLYVAEVYDVKRDGSTQKSYGRVFYTKGKSLIFYAYDLNEEPGVRDASTFQAWGRRGPDRQESLNLGIFYEDSAAKKRWVLKVDNPKALAEIDAVFVTVEPKGGSPKPSGKPLLSAYLQLSPNHP